MLTFDTSPAPPPVCSGRGVLRLAASWARSPQVTFPAGTAIYADSAAIAAGTQGSGAQQLYQAAFRDGTDAVGHATLSN